jgi:hypothetical protein
MITKEIEEKLIAVAREDYDGDDADEFEIVEVGEWIDDGKYSYQDTVILYNNKFYNVAESRSGSYFTDYDYQDPQVYEVIPTQVTKTVYAIVK